MNKTSNRHQLSSGFWTKANVIASPRRGMKKYLPGLRSSSHIDTMNAPTILQTQLIQAEYKMRTENCQQSDSPHDLKLILDSYGKTGITILKITLFTRTLDRLLYLFHEGIRTAMIAFGPFTSLYIGQ